MLAEPESTFIFIKTVQRTTHVCGNMTNINKNIRNDTLMVR